MPTIDDVSIINSNTAEAREVDSGLEKTLCSESLCESKTLDVYRRTILKGRAFQPEAEGQYHLLYVMETSVGSNIDYNNETFPAEEGAGVLLVPGESASFNASSSDIELLHMITPTPPPAIDEGLPSGPGYWFDRNNLRILSDASGGRVRRFCAESTVRLLDGSRLTPTTPFRPVKCIIMKVGRLPIINMSEPIITQMELHTVI